MELFTVEEREGKGKVLIASVDGLPGQVLFAEERPLMCVSNELVEQVKATARGEYATQVASYITFKLLSGDQRRQFLELHGPTSGVYSDQLRSLHRMLSIEQITATLPSPATPDAELEWFVKVNTIYRLNSFKRDAGNCVYKIATRMSHSCLPNCYIDFKGTAYTCRAILPVKAGDELTLEYNTVHRWKPVHIRRQLYAERKEFTCHCPRCDAEGDDTRQFDCFDASCRGVHYTRQPLNQEPIPFNACSYTGVEYVEPHLLPCTVCHRAPPLKYQQDMFALELKLLGIVAQMQEAETAIFDSSDMNKVPAVLSALAEVKFPSHHRIAFEIERITFSLHTKMMAYWRGEDALHPLHKAAVQRYVRLVEYFDYFPDKATASILCDVPNSLLINPTLCTIFVVECARKGLRMHQILCGRDARCVEYDQTLLTALKRLPPQPATTTECMYCRESPLRAAFTLSRCSRCKQVTYCSAGCQKAHWPLHKKCCSAKK